MKNDSDLKLHSSNLTNALGAGNPRDLEFVEEFVPTHPELGDVKTGFKPIRMQGVDIPEDLRVMYVRGVDGPKTYWYVVTWRGCDLAPKCVTVTSDDAARAMVLEELREWVQGRF